MKKRSEVLLEIEEAIAAHPKGKPLNDRGQLIPDPTPMAPPIGFVKQPSMVDIIRQQIKLAGEEAARDGNESFDEANDFDVGDEDFPQGAYEVDEEVEVPTSVLRQRAADAAKLDAEVAAEADAVSATTDVPKGPAKPPEGVPGA